MIEEALEHYQAGRYADAEALYRQMLEDEPDNPEVHFMLAMTRQQQSDLDAAATHLQQAIKAHAGNPTYHYALASVQIQRGELDRAVAAFSKATELDPNYLEAQSGLGYAHLSRRDWARAESALRSALRIDDSHLPTMVNMGIALLEQGRVDDALGYLQRAAQLDSGHAGAQLHLGRAFLAKGNAAFALQCFENTLSHHPDNADVLSLYAQAQERSGQLDAAADTYRRMLDLGEERSEALVGLSALHRRGGDRAAAESLLRRAIRKTEGDPAVEAELARLLLDEGRAGEAVDRLRPLVSSATASPALRLLLARAYFAADQTKAALDTLQPLLTEQTASPVAQALFARILFASGNTEAGEKQLDRLLEADAPPADALLLRAERLLLTSQPDEAVTLLRGAQRRRDIPLTVRHQISQRLGDALHANQQYQAAWEQWLSQTAIQSPLLLLQQEKAPAQADGSGGQVADQAPETAMRREVAWGWPPQLPEGERREPVFIYGWSGSGREPLLRALASHSGLQVLRDPARMQRDRRERIGFPRGAAALDGISEGELKLSRRRYWKLAERVRSRLDPQRPVLDGLWFSAASLPAIYRHFPQARVIMMNSEPEDLMLEWLRLGFTDLEAMGRALVQENAWLQACRDGVPLTYVEVDGARLRTSPGEVLRDLISDLELSWEDGVEPSYRRSSMHQPIRAGDWRHYREWLEDELQAAGRDGSGEPPTA